MEKDLLQRVIDTERDISKSVASEKEKAAAWLESVQQSCTDRVVEERQRFDRLFHQELERFVVKKKQEVAACITSIEEDTEALDCLPEQMFREVVLNHLQQILPGDGHDRQDVEDLDYRSPSVSAGSSYPGSPARQPAYRPLHRWFYRRTSQT